MSLYDLNALLVDVDALAKKIEMKRGTAMATAIEMTPPGGSAVVSPASLTAAATPRSQSWSLSLRGLSQVVPMVGCVAAPSPLEQYSAKSHELPEPAASSKLNAFSPSERLAFQNKVLHIMFLTEFVLLVEFTEIMIPVVYGAL